MLAFADQSLFMVCDVRTYEAAFEAPETAMC